MCLTRFDLPPSLLFLTLPVSPPWANRQKLLVAEPQRMQAPTRHKPYTYQEELQPPDAQPQARPNAPAVDGASLCCVHAPTTIATLTTLVVSPAVWHYPAIYALLRSLLPSIQHLRGARRLA